MPPKTNQEWVNGIKNKDEQTWLDLKKEIEVWSKAFVYKYQMEVSFADDIAQETMTRIFRHIDKFKLQDKSSFLGWCRVITQHEGLRLRKKNAVQPIELPETTVDISSELDPSRIELWLILKRCLDRLTEMERKVFELLYFHQLTPSEVAAQLGISQDYVNVLAHRARQKLQRCLSEEGIHS